MSDNAQALPGLDTAGRASNAMLRAATDYIEYLRNLGLIEGHHVLTVQLVLGLAEVIGKASAKGQAAAMAMGAKELREAMDLLPMPQAEGDAFAQIIAKMQEEDEATQ